MINDEPEEQETKRDQHAHSPRMYDDPDAVAEEEKRFGMAMPIGVAVIAAIFIVVIIIAIAN